MTIKKLCPNCRAPQKYQTKTNETGYELPTTYLCGTSDSPNWSPPLYSKECTLNPLLWADRDAANCKKVLTN